MSIGERRRRIEGIGIVCGIKIYLSVHFIKLTELTLTTRLITRAHSVPPFLKKQAGDKPLAIFPFFALKFNPSENTKRLITALTLTKRNLK